MSDHASASEAGVRGKALEKPDMMKRKLDLWCSTETGFARLCKTVLISIEMTGRR